MKLDAREIGMSFFQGLVGYHLRRAWVRSLSHFGEALGDEIKPVPFTVLCTIHETPGITAADIGRLLQMQRATLAPMLGELEKRGLIERRPDREDHRIQRLHLSEEGTAQITRWQARVLAQEERTFAALSAEERDALIELLAKVWID